MMDGDFNLPLPFKQGLDHLERQRDAPPRIDSITDNFAYIWVPDLRKASPDQSPGGWIRLPISFPFGNPHGLITIEALRRVDGTLVIDGHHPAHDICRPVRARGGANYYSWTWQGCPAIQQVEDITGVVQWYERRVRNG